MEQLDARKIGLRYAKAWLDAAEEQQQYDTIAADVRALQRLFLELPELTGFLVNPGIPMAEKSALIEKQFAQNVHSLTANLLSLLLQNDRIGLLQDIVLAALDLVNQKLGLVEAEVTVPVAINNALESELQQTLEKLFGYQQVDLRVKVDPTLLAGAIVRVGDKIIDGSYHGKLEMLKRQVG